MLIFTSLVLGGCFHGPQTYEGKTSEEWQAEFVRMEAKYTGLAGDFDGLKACLEKIEPGFLKSSNATVGEIDACLGSYSN